MNSDLGGAGAGVQGVVHVVGDVGGEAPVVAAVLEQVHDGHRGVAEPVDEHGLQKSLRVVKNPEKSSLKCQDQNGDENKAA